MYRLGVKTGLDEGKKKSSDFLRLTLLEFVPKKRLRIGSNGVAQTLVPSRGESVIPGLTDQDWTRLNVSKIMLEFPWWDTDSLENTESFTC